MTPSSCSSRAWRWPGGPPPAAPAPARSPSSCSGSASASPPTATDCPPNLGRVVDERSSIERNQAYWTTQAPDYAVGGRRDWGTDEVTWGQFRLPEAEVGVLPDVAGKDVVEIGCGT